MSVTATELIRTIYQQNNNGSKALTEEDTRHNCVISMGFRNKPATHRFMTSDVHDTGCTNPSYYNVN
jgi:hypothetical protein